jgi:predicted O-methyltransferase YrrM
MGFELTGDRWRYLTDYTADVFGAEDAVLAGIGPRAEAAGLPAIAVSPEIGRLLHLLTSTTRRRLAVEVGTLAGYSGIWIARALAPGGRLITIEKEPAHAAVAAASFERAGVGDRVEQRIGGGIDVLRDLRAELAPGSVDVIFLDALKEEYPDYWELARPLVAPGGFILADNIFGTDWWIGDETHPARAAVDRFNRSVAADPEFEAVAVPLRQGVLVGRRSA